MFDFLTVSYDNLTKDLNNYVNKYVRFFARLTSYDTACSILTLRDALNKNPSFLIVSTKLLTTHELNLEQEGCLLEVICDCVLEKGLPELNIIRYTPMDYQDVELFMSVEEMLNCYGDVVRSEEKLQNGKNFDDDDDDDDSSRNDDYDDDDVSSNDDNNVSDKDDNQFIREEDDDNSHDNDDEKNEIFDDSHTHSDSDENDNINDDNKNVIITDNKSGNGISHNNTSYNDAEMNIKISDEMARFENAKNKKYNVNNKNHNLKVIKHNNSNLRGNDKSYSELMDSIDFDETFNMTITIKEPVD